MAWTIDPAHTTISFAVKHMMISTVRGYFEDFSGTVELDEQRPELAKVDVTVNLASINTRNEQRDGHLRSPDFFDADANPTMRFVSSRVERTGEDTAKLHGDLTIRGVTHPVVLDVDYEGTGTSPWGTTSAGFTARGKINRKDWGLTWNQALETGGLLVGEEVKIEIDAELLKQQDQSAGAA